MNLIRRRLVLGCFMGLAALGMAAAVQQLGAAATSTAAPAATAPTATAATSSTATGMLPKDSVKTGQYAQTFDTHVEAQPQYDCQIYIPADYAKARGPWPLVLFLHGAGESGSDVEKVKIHGPPKLIAAGKTFPAIVVSPQNPVANGWKVKALEGLLDEIQKKYDVDTKRIYLTGLSMGGMGTWSLAIDQPTRFAALAPMAARGDATKVAVLKDVPIWVFHGDKDPTVPVKGDQDMVNALKAAGSTVRFTIYPGVGHDSWTASYENPELWIWMFSQRQK